MAKRKPKAHTFDEILLDLLSSGLGASLILMLIFSLNLSGLFNSQKVSSNEAPLPNVGDASLYSKDKQQIKKAMSSVRYVMISTPDLRIINQIAESGRKLEDLWILDDDGWKSSDCLKLAKELNKTYQVELRDNVVVFYFIVDHVCGTIVFALPNVDLGGAKISAGIIEGNSTILSEALPDKIYRGPSNVLPDDQNGVKVTFITGNLRNKNLIRIK